MSARKLSSLILTLLRPHETFCSFFLTCSCPRTFALAIPLPGILFPDVCVTGIFSFFTPQLECRLFRGALSAALPPVFLEDNPIFPFQVQMTIWRDVIDIWTFAVQGRRPLSLTFTLSFSLHRAWHTVGVQETFTE